jgi:hypothetical protein
MKRSQDTTLINKIIQENWVQESMFVLREAHAAIGIWWFFGDWEIQTLSEPRNPLTP